MIDQMEDALEQSLLVKLELLESVNRMMAEGMDFRTILAGIAALANDLISKEYDSATAAGWFELMAQLARCT